MRTATWILLTAAATAVAVRLPAIRGDETAADGVERPLVLHADFECRSSTADPGPNVLRRLTVPEYVETVRAAVGVDIAKDAARLLPPDVRADGFANTAYNLNVDLGHVEAYARLAQIAVGRMDLKTFLERHAECRSFDEPCLRGAISRVGKWLLRGPLSKDEIDQFAKVAEVVHADGGGFDESMSYVVEAMLQSPRFLYLVEDRSGDGTPRAVGGYELASRLSYVLWGGPPDSELLRAAESGELSDRRTVETQVRRMLADPRAIERSKRFVHDWLHLGRLENLRPNAERFSKWRPELGADMRDETLAFFEEVVWNQKRPLSDLLNAQVTFATPRLARHYGLNGDPLAGVPDGASGRSARDMIALYTFAATDGDVVRDVSGNDPPLDLRIADTKAVGREDGGLVVRKSTQIISEKPPGRLIDALKKSGEITIDVWLTPADTTQEGPARIVSLSSGTSNRNFTLGQEKDAYDVRLRTTKRDRNGMPSVSSPKKTVKPKLTHVVYTRDKTGRAKLYIDGEQVAAGNVDGDLRNWDGGYRLVLANETSNDRPWLGTLHRVAIHARALDAEEVQDGGWGPRRFDLADVPYRGGLLTQGSVLTMGGDNASMVTRGLFVLHDLLSGEVDDPPPCVDTTPIPTEPGLSQREISEQRIADPACGACHTSFEPFAFGLEKFDGIGRYREKDEHGNVLREDAEMRLPDGDETIDYETIAELADALAASERVKRTLTMKVAQFALGRPLVESDGCHLREIHATAWKSGGTYADLITAIVTSDLVLMTRTEKPRQEKTR